MRILSFAAVIAVGAVATAAFAQSAVVTIRRLPDGPAKSFDQVKISKAAQSGQEIRLWAAQMLEPDCSAHGSMKTDILEQPQHGQLRLADDMFFSSFPAGNARAACNTKKSPGREAFYTAAANFHGHDQVVLQNSTSEGQMRKIVVDIDVR
jgi:hypothetical protein